MDSSGRSRARRTANETALAAFGISAVEERTTPYKTVRSGSSTTVFTIGYERRDLADLLFRLHDVAVEILVDIRERPHSRKLDFRKSRLEAACKEANIQYESWRELGSTGAQRDRLKETGDFADFRRRFRQHVRRGRGDALKRLAAFSKQRQIALLCYERCHDECHRSVVAELIADAVDATVVAIE